VLEPGSFARVHGAEVPDAVASLDEESVSTVYRIVVRDDSTKAQLEVCEMVGTEAEMEVFADKVQKRWPDADLRVSEVDEELGAIHMPKTKVYPEHALHGVPASLVETVATGYRVRLHQTKGILRCNDIVLVGAKEWNPS
jgi:hypothetical protein